MVSGLGCNGLHLVREAPVKPQRRHTQSAVESAPAGGPAVTDSGVEIEKGASESVDCIAYPTLGMPVNPNTEYKGREVGRQL